ncbi:allophanate hydrolase [Brachybacterium vulturis]|uniref:Allophanate hydrolase n=1 Tax=Brachybacterium vulturis TaxID=2017484 RepID=A0A291GL17_9MICO|nr:carboxyltransferase domain-containing protein [Brachybacterium vulturis]ATG50760.1 allophanate hydrolase [Brachybacterium vulturis]
MTRGPDRTPRRVRRDRSDRLEPPLAVHRAGEVALLAEYPDTRAVLAAAAAVGELAPATLLDLVPAERTLLLVGSAAQDLPVLDALLRDLPGAATQEEANAEVSVDIVYDGEDLAEVAELLEISTQALITAHSAATWTAAFGGFAPGFAYLLPDAPTDPARPVGPPWEVPRRAEPRTEVPAGAVGLAARYCGIYPRSSPGGWQLIGRTDVSLFDVDREPPALLTPGTRVRFTPRRPTARASARTAAFTQVARDAAAVPGRRGRRRGAAGAPTSGQPALEVLAPGPLTLLEDTGRPGRAASGVSCSGAFDRGAMLRANLAVGNPTAAAVLEIVAGPLRLQARAATVIAVSGARAPLVLHRADPESTDLELSPEESHELPIALDPGDRLELGPVTEGLRLVLAVRGGLRGVGAAGAVLGSLSRDTLSALGPAPLVAGDLLLVGPEERLDAVPTPVRGEDATLLDHTSPAVLDVPVHAGPRDALLGAATLRQLLATTWTVRPDSDRVGVRLDGDPLTAPSDSGSSPSEPMRPGAIQVPPSGSPVVFGPDHPTTGGYPVIAVVTREGLDALAQAATGTGLRFVAVPSSPR